LRKDADLSASVEPCHFGRAALIRRLKMVMVAPRPWSIPPPLAPTAGQRQPPAVKATSRAAGWQQAEDEKLTDDKSKTMPELMVRRASVAVAG
jgi:hypothetical protein